MPTKAEIEALKSRVPISRIVEDMHVEIHQRGNSLTACCPFHREDTPSFHIHDDKGFCHCFGCDKSWDHLALIQESKGVDFPEALKVLNDYDGGRMNLLPASKPSQNSKKQSGPKPRKQQPETTLKDPPDFQSFASQYGLEPEDFYAADFTFAESSFPFTSGGKHQAIKYPILLPSGDIIHKYKSVARSTDKNKRVQIVVPSRPGEIGIIGFDDLPRSKNKTLVYAGGEEKVLAARRVGFHAICLQNGEKAPPDDVANLIASHHPAEIVIAFDADEAGVKGAFKSAEVFLARNIPVRRVVWPSTAPKGHDLNDVLATEGTAALRLKLENAEILNGMDIKEALDPKNNEWPDPQPLDELSSGLPDFPFHSLPYWISDFVYYVAHRTQTPPEICACTALSCVSATLAHRVEVVPWSGWAEPLNLWTMVAAATGERKSAVFKSTLAPVWKREQDLIESHRQTAAKKGEELNVLKGQLEDARKSARKGDRHALQEAARLALEVESKSVESSPVLTTNDITPEKLAEVLAENGGRIAVFDDEGRSFIDTVTGSRYSGATNLDLFLKSYSGGNISIHRKTSEPIHVEKALMSIGIATQPNVLEKLSAIDGARDRGVLARFLFSIPKSLVGERVVDPDMTEYDPQVEDEYNRLILAMFKNAPFYSSGPSVIPFEPSARDRFIDYLRVIESSLKRDGDLRPVLSWATRANGHLARLAGVINCATNADGEFWKIPISRASVDKAIMLLEYFQAHTFAAFDQMGALHNDEKADAKKILRILVKSGQNAMPKRDLMRSSKFKADRFDFAVQQLEKMDCIQVEEDRSGGRRPLQIIVLNPKVRVKGER